MFSIEFTEGSTIKVLLVTTEIPSGPLVSILIPIFNGEKYLQRCLHSALNQTYPNTEIIIVDDHSTDHSLEIVRAFNNPHIKIFHNEGERGSGAAWNKCIQSSQGPYYCFLHQDDCLHPQYIETMLREISHHGDTAVYCEALHIDKDDRQRFKIFNQIKYQISKRHPVLDLENLRPLFAYDLIMCPTMFYDRKKMETIGLFNTKLKTALDYEMWFRILFGGGTIRFVPQKLYSYRYHHGMDSHLKQKDLTKYHEDYELKKQVQRMALTRGIKLSSFTLKKTILAILSKDALNDCLDLRVADCWQKFVFGLQVVRWK